MDLALFILGLVILLGAVIFARWNKKMANEGEDHAPGYLIISTFVVAAVLIALASTTVVAPRKVGIEVAFGKPVATHSNGLHLKFPWSDVEKMDGSMQNPVYKNGGSHAPVEVRLKNQSIAHADASIQWQLKNVAAEQLFLDFRSFERIESSVVDRNFLDAMNEALGTYDPLASFAEGKSEDKVKSELSKMVLDDMRNRVGKSITIHSVTIPFIEYDKATQKRLNELQSEIAKTRIAEQKKETSRAEAAANRELQAAITPEVLTSKCLDIIADTKGSPIGCFPNSGVMPITQVQ